MASSSTVLEVAQRMAWFRVLNTEQREALLGMAQVALDAIDGPTVDKRYWRFKESSGADLMSIDGKIYNCKFGGECHTFSSVEDIERHPWWPECDATGKLI